MKKLVKKHSGQSNVVMVFNFNGYVYQYLPSGDHNKLAVLKDGKWSFLYDVEEVDYDSFTSGVFFHEKGDPKKVVVTATYVG